jgi:hypothetical protein
VTGYGVRADAVRYTLGIDERPTQVQTLRYAPLPAPTMERASRLAAVVFALVVGSSIAMAFAGGRRWFGGHAFLSLSWALVAPALSLVAYCRCAISDRLRGAWMGLAAAVMAMGWWVVGWREILDLIARVLSR